MEAQYQNEVRLAIENLYAAFVDVLAARETIRYLKKSIKGLDEVVRVAEGLYEKRTGTRADVDQAKSDREIAVAGGHRRRGNAPAAEACAGRAAESVARRGRDARAARNRCVTKGPPPPPLRRARRRSRAIRRPDVAAFRLGVEAASANVRLQRANRFSDAYLLYQPYTFQNNAPFGKQSGTSWALGITVPLPLYNRNQGNIERARINVVPDAGAARAPGAPVGRPKCSRRSANIKSAARIVRRHARERGAGAQARYEDRLELFREGEDPKIVVLNAQRKYNEAVKDYLDAAVRHRRSMLDLNTVVGQRIMP